MSFDKWLEENKPGYTKGGPLYGVGKEAWNAAIEAAAIAVDHADHNSDDSGFGANCNAMMAVERLKAV